jgi:hypothetical protein
LYIIVYFLLHWHMWQILQSGGSIMYSYMFHIMKYYVCCICFILYKQHLYLRCERLYMAGLDDCSILQPGYLVKNRMGGMHDSISAQNIRSHSFACMSSEDMSRTTKEHLAWHDLRALSLGCPRAFTALPHHSPPLFPFKLSLNEP